MLKRILLAFDGSSYAQKAADYVVKTAQGTDMEVVILTVREPTPTYSSRVVFDRVELEKELQEKAEKIISKAEEKFKDSGIKYVTKILAGDPADVICQEASENQVTEIVMGNRGMNQVSRLILGSVSNKVINSSPCTVVIVK